MTSTRIRLVLACVSFVLVGRAAAHGQSYGAGDQTLTIGAAEFQANFSFPAVNDVMGPDGYLYGNFTTTTWWAPVVLPDGAWIGEMCVYYKDDVTGLFSLGFGQGTLAAPGEVPAPGACCGFVVSTHDDGYQSRCVGINKRLRDLADPDGDGTPSPVTNHLKVSATGAVGFGGVRIVWNRDVSPPPAAPSFGDVPVIDPAWSQIEALAASGITSGCGGGNYCPDATLTRRQMAVFIAKALGLQWAY